MRSDRPRSSGRSEEATMTATPSRRELADRGGRGRTSRPRPRRAWVRRAAGPSGRRRARGRRAPSAGCRPTAPRRPAAWRRALSRTSCPSASAARPCRRGSRNSAPRAMRDRCGSATFSTMERRSISPSAAPLARDVGEARGPCGDRRGRDGAPREPHLARAGKRADQRAEERAAPGPGEPGDAEHLARAEVEADAARRPAR